MITSSTIKTKQIRFSIVIDGKEIGRARLSLIPNDLHSSPYGLLEDVWVDEEFRKSGYGSKLVRKIISRAKKEKCYKLIATSRKSRKKVHELYKKLGFVSHGYEFRIDL